MAGSQPALILASILISSIGTHGYISRLTQPPPRPRIALPAVFREMFETLSNRSFLSIFVAAMFANVAVGLGSALSVYFSTYFWGFTPIQIGFITLAIFLSALVGAALAPVMTRALGKKRGAIVIGLAGLIISPAAVLLRLLGVLSDGSDSVTFWTVLIQGQLYVATVVCFQVLMASMIADLVEQSELKTGRRSEGVFFAANTFIQKMTTGLGVMAATLVLTLARFPAGADPSQVTDEVLQSLGWRYLPAMLLLHLATIAAILTYSLTRQTHEENLRKLAGAEQTP